MFHSELFVKIRAYVVLCFLVIISPIALVLSWIYAALELCVRFRKFKNIEGEVAVVTGAGHGLGRCIALLLAEQGCDIAIADINLDGAEETVNLIRSKYKVKSKAYKVEVSRYEQVVDLNESIKKDLGTATILINNAGVLTLSSFCEPPTEEIQHMLNVNLLAHFWTIRVFLENMKQKGKGHIVAVCSIAGMLPIAFNSPYVSSKFGVRGMMRSLRIDLKTLGYSDIRTTTLCPTFLQTNAQVVEYSNISDIGALYPLVKGEDAAKIAVHAMLRNEVEVCIPRGFAIFSRLLDIFPSNMQDKLYLLTAKSFIKKFQQIYKAHEELIKGKEKKNQL